MALDISFVLGFLVVSFGTAEIKLACSRGEVSKPYTFTCNVNGSVQFITWRKGQMESIADCTRNDCSCPNRVTCETNGYAVSRSNQSSSLTILNVTVRSIGVYSCESGGSDTAIYNFTAFAKPEHVICQDVDFRAQTNEIEVVCTAQRVYPYPKCQFTWILNDTMSRTVPETLITYGNMLPSGDDDYYKAKCSLKLPAQNFSVGSHQFQVMVYPTVTGIDNDTAYGRDSNQTSPQYVAIPSFKLESCPDTSLYVEEGKSFGCTCRETANNFILSTTTLSYGTTRISTTQNVTTNFTADRNIGVLTCEAQLPDGTNNRMTQTIQVAYGPKNVSMSVIYNQTESDVISFCDQPVAVTASCTVPANNYNPGVTYQFHSNVIDTPAAPSSMATVNYTVRSGGLFYIMCTANNSQLPWLSVNITKIIQVIEPPSLPVLETYQDGGTSIVEDQLTVEEGVVKIGCRVNGGYPPVSSVLLECGSQTSKDNNLYIDVNINISRHMDGTKCSCTANHSSSCYTNNKALTVLDVHFGPAILNFEANNNSQEIIVERDSIVSFSCQAEGNPIPHFSLRNNGTELVVSTDATHKFNQTLTYSKIMAKCLDTGVYTCLAERGQTTRNKTVAVYVKCKPEFRDSTTLIEIHQAQVNGTVSINVPVYGYPEPNVTLSSTKYTLSSDEYNLVYLQQEPPYGNVSLTINITNSNYFQNYTLNINNTEGPLSYSFQIVHGDPVKPDSRNNGPSGTDVGAIVGGIVAAVLVIVIIFVIIFFLKRKGGPCNKKQQNGNTLMNTPYGSDSSVNHQTGSGDAEVIVDNSDLYNLQWQSDEVEVDNSPLYNLNRHTPAIRGRDSQYKNYSEVTPTITTATSAPLNMGNKKTNDISNPYEDVSSGEKSKPKPPTNQKPKPVAKPKPQSDKQAKNNSPDQTYAMVVKLNKSDKPFAIKEENDEFFLDPSLQPEIPEKNFENPYEDTNNEKITEKKSSGRKKNKAGKPKGKAPQQPKDLSSVTYTNSGFSNPEEEVNVYANTDDLTSLSTV